MSHVRRLPHCELMPRGVRHPFAHVLFPGEYVTSFNQKGSDFIFLTGSNSSTYQIGVIWQSSSDYTLRKSFKSAAPLYGLRSLAFDKTSDRIIGYTSSGGAAIFNHAFELLTYTEGLAQHTPFIMLENGQLLRCSKERALCLEDLVPEKNGTSLRLQRVATLPHVKLIEGTTFRTLSMAELPNNEVAICGIDGAPWIRVCSLPELIPIQLLPIECSDLDGKDGNFFCCMSLLPDDILALAISMNTAVELHYFEKSATTQRWESVLRKRYEKSDYEFLTLRATTVLPFCFYRQEGVNYLFNLETGCIAATILDTVNNNVPPGVDDILETENELHIKKAQGVYDSYLRVNAAALENAQEHRIASAIDSFKIFPGTIGQRAGVGGLIASYAVTQLPTLFKTTPITRRAVPAAGAAAIAPAAPPR